MDLLLDVARECGAVRRAGQRSRRRPAGCGDPAARRLVAPADRRRDRMAVRRSHPRQHHGDDRLVITTIVSSSLLGRMAEAAGVHVEETFTGFKWIGRIVTDHPDLRFVFGYEQALGYLVTHRPLDKDGISAAVMMAEIAGLALAEGVTLQDRLDAIAERFGRYVTAELSVRLDPALGAEGSLRSGRPAGRGRRAGGHGGVDVSARRAWSGWWSTAASGSRSARAAPSRRSSSTARPSTSTARCSTSSSPPSPPPPRPHPDSRSRIGPGTDARLQTNRRFRGCRRVR